MTMTSSHASAPPVLALLEQLTGYHETPPSSGRFMACCPAHDDHTPSLSIGFGDDGRVLLKCFAGCDPDTIRVALGVPWTNYWRDYFPNGVAPGEKCYPVKDYNGKTRGTQQRYYRDNGKKDTPWIGHDAGATDMPLYGSEKTKEIESGAQVILLKAPTPPRRCGAEGYLPLGP